MENILKKLTGSSAIPRATALAALHNPYIHRFQFNLMEPATYVVDGAEVAVPGLGIWQRQPSYSYNPEAKLSRRCCVAVLGDLIARVTQSREEDTLGQETPMLTYQYSLIDLHPELQIDNSLPYEARLAAFHEVRLLTASWDFQKFLTNGALVDRGGHVIKADAEILVPDPDYPEFDRVDPAYRTGLMSGNYYVGTGRENQGRVGKNVYMFVPRRDFPITPSDEIGRSRPPAEETTEDGVDTSYVVPPNIRRTTDRPRINLQAEFAPRFATEPINLAIAYQEMDICKEHPEIMVQFDTMFSQVDDGGFVQKATSYNSGGGAPAADAVPGAEQLAVQLAAAASE